MVEDTWCHPHASHSWIHAHLTHLHEKEDYTGDKNL